ncbi:MAG TPA: sugar ABC transporter ATP-binding protein [Clostridiales bacterium]|nr:sugar ABC transporter ATP-binding protein [Clostridiales bacterium]
MAGILLKNVTKIYPNKFKALENLDLEIKDKEFLVLVGSSGCGKSTILRIIAGLESVADGTVNIGDKVVNNVSPKDRNIAMVFQDYALYPHMNVYENMAFSLKLKKVKKNEIKEKILAVANKLEIEECLYKKPATLSGGQKQRVALGRAIIRDPEVFLFDEPLSNIDAKLRTQMRIELIRLHRQLKTTFVYVTHDQTEAMTMGERIVVMKDGKIQQIDTPENLYNNPNNIFTASFIGLPQMNFISGRLKNENDARMFIELDCVANKSYELKNTYDFYDNRQITVGVRPEKLFIKKNNEHLDDVIVFENCEVEAVEMLGAEQLVYFNFNGAKLISKVFDDIKITKNDRLSLFCNINDIHIFDTVTERKLDVWKRQG